MKRVHLNASVAIVLVAILAVWGVNSDKVAKEKLVWSIETLHGRGTVDGLGQYGKHVFIKLDWNKTISLGDTISNSTTSGDHARGTDLKHTTAFQLIDGSIIYCKLAPSVVISPVLASKFQSLRAWDGVCTDGYDVSINLDSDHEGSLSAVFRTPSGDFVYVDSMRNFTGTYVMYKHSDIRQDTDAASNPLNRRAKDTVLDETLHSQNAEENVTYHGRRLAENIVAERVSSTYVFRMALIANAQYSRYHGNTKQSVLNEMIKVLTRINGIFVHELGVYFELIPDVDKLICLSGDVSCAHLRNDHEIIYDNPNFIKSSGIKLGDYDIGHSLSTNSGGVAASGSICVDHTKSMGTTGRADPVGDAFLVDFVSHELAHQLSAHHTFRRCSYSQSNNLATETAVEPGSGSTIMGYAGLCGKNDVQPLADPYFNSVSLQQMREHLDTKTASDPTCGTKTELAAKMPGIKAASTCNVPVGNSFQLRADTVDGLKYTWERIDPSVEDYQNLSVARFRSWEPITSRSRYFPNLYYQTFPKAQSFEILPKDEDQMRFRFTSRKSFHSAVTVDKHVPSASGDFASVDTVVNFITSVPPLKWTYNATNCFPGVVSNTMVEFTWTASEKGTNLYPKVLIYLAENTMKEVDDFDYGDDLKELDWILVGEVENNGTATLKVPSLPNANGVKEVNFMIRSIGEGDDSCFFFDLATRVPVYPAGEPLPSSANDCSRRRGDGTDSGTLDWVLVGSIAGGCVALVLGLSVLYCFCRRQRKYATDDVSLSSTRKGQTLPGPQGY